MPHQVAKLWLAVLPEKAGVVVQADQAPAADHLADLVVGEVPGVGAHAAGVGVAGHEGAVYQVQQLIKARVVEMGHVDEDARLLQPGDSRSAQGGQAVVGGVAGAQGVLPVPGEGEHPHPVPGQPVNFGQISAQGRAVFHGENGRRFALGPGPADILRCAALGGVSPD